LTRVGSYEIKNPPKNPGLIYTTKCIYCKFYFFTQNLPTNFVNHEGHEEKDHVNQTGVEGKNGLVFYSLQKKIKSTIITANNLQRMNKQMHNYPLYLAGKIK
jgi:hypothetical protein